MNCTKCRAVVDEDGRGTDGYFTCGYGGSHRPGESRPRGAARISAANKRTAPGRRSVRRIIRKQQVADAKEAGVTPADRARQALQAELAAFRGVSERDRQSGVLD